LSQFEARDIAEVVARSMNDLEAREAKGGRKTDMLNTAFNGVNAAGQTYNAASGLWQREAEADPKGGKVGGGKGLETAINGASAAGELINTGTGIYQTVKGHRDLSAVEARDPGIGGILNIAKGVFGKLFGRGEHDNLFDHLPRDAQEAFAAHVQARSTLDARSHLDERDLAAVEARDPGIGGILNIAKGVFGKLFGRGEHDNLFDKLPRDAQEAFAAHVQARSTLDF